MLNRASSNTEVLHCVLKSSAQAVPQTPEVNACLKSPFTVIHSWSGSWSWSCLGNPLLRKGSFGLLLRQRKHFFSPPPQESNTQHIAVKPPKSLQKGEEQQCPLQRFRLQKRCTPFQRVSAESTTTSATFKVSPSQQM